MPHCSVGGFHIKPKASKRTNKICRWFRQWFQDHFTIGIGIKRDMSSKQSHVLWQKKTVEQEPFVQPCLDLLGVSMVFSEEKHVSKRKHVFCALQNPHVKAIKGAVWYYFPTVNCFNVSNQLLAGQQQSPAKALNLKDLSDRTGLSRLMRWCSESVWLQRFNASWVFLQVMPLVALSCAHLLLFNLLFELTVSESKWGESHRSMSGKGLGMWWMWWRGREWYSWLVPGRGLVEAGGELATLQATPSTQPTLHNHPFRAQKLRIATGQMAAAGDVQTSWERDTGEKRGEAWWERKDEETSAQGCSDVPGGLTTSFS